MKMARKYHLMIKDICPFNVVDGQHRVDGFIRSL